MHCQYDTLSTMGESLLGERQTYRQNLPYFVVGNLATLVTTPAHFYTSDKCNIPLIQQQHDLKLFIYTAFLTVARDVCWTSLPASAFPQLA